MTLASVDGTIRPIEQATIPVSDEGLLRGDGIFEVLRLYCGRPFALDEHLARLRLSSENLRLPVDVDTVRAELEALLSEAGPVEALLRLVVTRGGHRLALIEPLPQHPESIRVGYVTYAPPRILSGIKSLSYAANMLAIRLANERGFDDALLVTPHGRVLEAPTSSLFWVRGDDLLTPPLDDHILDSITRRILVEDCHVREESCTCEELEAADEAFLASTVREVQPIAAVEGVELATGSRTAEAARSLRARIDAAVAA
jgi:branched-chain amino acid aminotransferase